MPGPITCLLGLPGRSNQGKHLKNAPGRQRAGHTLGLKEDGTVVACGWNRYGQTEVEAWRNIAAIYAGPFCSIGITGNGELLAVGLNKSSQLNLFDWTLFIHEDPATGRVYVSGDSCFIRSLSP